MLLYWNPNVLAGHSMKQEMFRMGEKRKSWKENLDVIFGQQREDDQQAYYLRHCMMKALNWLSNCFLKEKVGKQTLDCSLPNAKGTDWGDNFDGER